MSKNKKILITLSSLLLTILVAAVITGTLFAYKPDLFVNHRRDMMTFDLKHRKIEIPLEHKFSFSSPSITIFKTNNSAEEICEMFADSLDENETVINKRIGEIDFIYFYVNGEFSESIWLESWGADGEEFRIGLSSFVPLCLYSESDDFVALFQDKSKLADGRVYVLKAKRFDDSFDRLEKYFENIYETHGENGVLKAVVDGKRITLKEE